MAGIEPVDVSAMFPDFAGATATRDGDVAVVELIGPSAFGPIQAMTLRLRVNAIYQALEDLRKLEPVGPRR